MAISASARVALMVAYSLLFLFGTFGNICVILVILTSKRFRKFISSILITNIAIADLMVCLLSAPYYLACLLLVQPEKPGPEALESACRGFIFFAYSLGFTRIILLAVISMERFLAINRPYFYHKHCSSTLPNLPAMLVCFYPWFHAFLTTSPTSFMKGWARYVGKAGKLCGYTWENANLGFVVSLMVINFCIPLTIIVFTNFKVFLTSRRQRRSIASCFSTTSPTNMSLANCEQANFAVNGGERRKIGRQMNYSLQFCNQEEKACGQNLPRIQSQISSNWGCHDEFKLSNALHPSKSQLLTRIESHSSNVNSNNKMLSSASLTKLSSDNSGETSRTHVNLEAIRPLRISVGSKVDDSGFKDESLRRFSNLSSGIALPARRKPRRSSISVINESLVSARKYLIGRGQFTRRQTISGVPSLKFHVKTSDFVVYFSTLSVITLFLCTWLPFVAVTIIILVSQSVVSEEVDLAVSMITVIDSAFTPYIVLGTRREFRKALLRKLCKSCSN